MDDTGWMIFVDDFLRNGRFQRIDWTFVLWKDSLAGRDDGRMGCRREEGGARVAM